MSAPPVALTPGDPAGVGGEIALRAWAALRESGPAFVAIGDARHLAGLGERLGVPVRVVAEPAAAAAAMPHGLPVLDHPWPAPPVLGRPDRANAPAVVAAIDLGVALARSGAAAALCTNPISKLELMEGAGFGFPGHTEYLAHLAGAPLAVMMLASPLLRVAPVTVHVPLAEAAARLTPGLLEATLRVTRDALVGDFGVAAPRIAVAGLNPHAGEGGKLGREEIEVIAPVLERLRGEGFRLDGPRSADTLFHPAARAGYDAAVCMYHDQALIPIKTLDFAGGVNVTLGLDFVRTSPDHGTAHDIAAGLVADPSSLIAALRLAAELGARRAAARPAVRA
ncbi:4-hydroxythreonine-4-phosphate dehydrogenase PdxA [Amaricoccus sp.]|uniref:4-hydroxythreonine-4-phosphate dehydrogenase PdxA n=1 Tax=Amaricoccus sp. TaxID=1872485 RepID=UPI001B5DFE1A|nr:4-hydroxythreonine-4-phosphate dehydrogenase PdxA [Amaricoccus sp.]MBP7002849.1 4-hydroxythreonine-4-phosphate dehydrogenase PdxA [Amaricoccus sp.]